MKKIVRIALCAIMMAVCTTAVQAQDNNQSNKQRMERSQKILDLREKYYKKYSAFLTQKQIERVYELEHKAMKRLSKKGYRAPRGKGQPHGKPSRNK